MKNPRWFILGRVLALLAGTMDVLTGLGLVFAPALTLRAMLAPVPAADALVYVRFTGAFVFSIGAAYLWAWLRGERQTLRAVFRFTLPFLLSAALFTGGAVLAGALAPAWLSVTGTDLLLVVLQVRLLRDAARDDE